MIIKHNGERVVFQRTVNEEKCMVKVSASIIDDLEVEELPCVRTMCIVSNTRSSMKQLVCFCMGLNN